MAFMGDQNSNVRDANSKDWGSNGWTRSKDVLPAKGTADRISAVFGYPCVCNMEMNVQEWQTVASVGCNALLRSMFDIAS